MLILDSTSKSIEIHLGGAVATNQLPIVVNYVDITTTTFTPGASDTISNNGTVVTIVSAPAASTQRQVKYISIYNEDTAQVSLTVQLNNSGTLREILVWTMEVGDTVFYIDSDGWSIRDSAGATKMISNISGTAGGDLSGTYPNPTVSKINGVALGTTTATSGNLLIANGTQWATQAVSGDATLASGGGLTLATVNSNVGSFGSATQVGSFTVNAKGLITAASNITVTPAASSVTGGQALSKSDDTNVTLSLGGSPTTALLAATSLTLGWTGTLSGARGGTGVANTGKTITLGGNLVTAGAFNTTITVSADTNVTLPDSGTLYGTKANSITSAELITSVTDETGTGVLVFNTAPTFVTSITTPLIIGGTGVGSSAEIRSTSGVGATDFIKFTGGNNGATEFARFLTGGQFVIGATTLTAASEWLSVQKNQNAATSMVIFNNNGLTASQMRSLYSNGTTSFTFGHTGTGFTASGIITQDGSYLQAAGTGGLSIGATNASAGIRFYSGSSTVSSNINNVGRWFFGGSTFATALVHLAAGTATASTAPIKLTSGTNLTTAETGAIEYNGTNLFFTRTGTTRESIICANAVNVVSPTAQNRTITVVIDGVTYYISAKTTND